MTYSMSFSLLLLFVCSVAIATGCLEPDTVATSDRFSIAVWSDVAQGTVFSSDTFIVKVATDNVTISVETPSVNFTFPSFAQQLFPGAIALSYYRFTWSAYALRKTCNGFDMVSKQVTVDPFLFEAEDVRMSIPSRYPLLSWFEPNCEVDDVTVLYSQTGDFTVPSGLFTQAYVPTMYKNTTTIYSTQPSLVIDSACVEFPRQKFRLLRMQDLDSSVHVGESKLVPSSLEEEEELIVNGTYGSFVNGYYKTYDTVDDWFEGVDYLKLPDVYYRIQIIPSLSPRSEVVYIEEDEQNVTVQLAADVYRRNPHYFFRAISHVSNTLKAGQLILPTENITISKSFAYSLMSCGGMMQNATITVRVRTPITMDTSSVPVGQKTTSATSFLLSDYLTVSGDPGGTLESRFLLSRGHFTNQLCSLCTEFEFDGTVDEIKGVLNSTTVLSSNPFIEYDGLRAHIGDQVAYVRFSAESTGDSPNKDEGSWKVVIIFFTAFGLFVLALIAYLLSMCGKSSSSIKKKNVRKSLK